MLDIVVPKADEDSRSDDFDGECDSISVEVILRCSKINLAIHASERATYPTDSKTKGGVDEPGGKVRESTGDGSMSCHFTYSCQ
jgi:hypothetical protein